MWLANALTVSRIPLAVVFWLVYADRLWAVLVVAVAALTDALDGTVARWLRARAAAQGLRVSNAGEWLDPLADKLFVVIAVAAVAVHEHTPWFIVAAVGARELLLVPLALAYRFGRTPIAHAFRADPIGKATTIGQLVTVGALVVHVAWAPACALATGALGLVAVAHYIARIATPAAAARER